MRERPDEHLEPNVPFGLTASEAASHRARRVEEERYNDTLATNNANPKYQNSSNHSFTRKHSWLGKWLVKIGTVLILGGVLTFFLDIQTPALGGFTVPTMSFILGIGMIILAWAARYIGMLFFLLGVFSLYLGGIGEGGFSLATISQAEWISGGTLMLIGFFIHKVLGRK